MKKKIILTITLLFLLLILIIGSLVYFLYDPGSYDIRINREYSTKEERLALETAEGFDYCTLFHRERLNGSWNNFIDSEVVSYYRSEIIERRNNEDGSHNSLIYNALAVKMDYCEIDYNDNYIDLISDEISFNDFFSWGYDESMFAILNETHRSVCWYPKERIQLNYTDVYLVRMELDYGHSTGPLCAIHSYSLQYVIFNSDLEPVFIVISPSMHEVS